MFQPFNDGEHPRAQLCNPEDEVANPVVSVNRYDICNHLASAARLRRLPVKNEQTVERLPKAWIGSPPLAVFRHRNLPTVAVNGAETNRSVIVQYLVVIATSVLLLVTSSAVAQEMPTEHKVGLSVYAGAAILDYHSTYKSMKVGNSESNPLGRFTEGKPGATVLVGASIDAVVTPLLYRWLGRKHPNLTTVLLYTAAAFRTNLAVANYDAAAARRRMLATERP
jgi:hypothetical protein